MKKKRKKKEAEKYNKMLGIEPTFNSIKKNIQAATLTSYRMEEGASIGVYLEYDIDNQKLKKKNRKKRHQQKLTKIK